MDKKGFEGRTAIVTGAGQGIGFEISRQLAARGASVILNDIDPQLSDRAAQRIIAEKGACLSVPGDSSEPETIANMVAAATTRFGSLDIVIANAGITLFGDFLDYPAASFYSVMKVNLGGTFFGAGCGP